MSDELTPALEESLVDTLVTKCEALLARVAELEALIKESRPFVLQINHSAEFRHDTSGEIFDYTVMQQTENLIERINKSLNP